MILAPKQIEQLLHGNKDWALWVSPLQDILPKYEINSVNRIAGFMAQCGHESLNFSVLEENLNYSAKGLNIVFSKYFERAGRDAKNYHRKPERIANVVYASRMGNGDTESGDGWRYRGRGAIQLTGKHSYSRFAQSLGFTLSEAVRHLQSCKGALESACWFWEGRNLNAVADAQDIEKMTRLINGGLNGIADRKHHYQHALKILGGDYTPVPRPILLKLGSTGTQVKELQRALGLDVDGHFGRVTEAAVIEFQKRHKLLADGIVGPKTFNKISK